MDKERHPRQTLKRPRPVVSCLNCRRKKLKCDRSLPCEQCVKSGASDHCCYAPGQHPSSTTRGSNDGFEKQQPDQSTDAIAPSEITPARFDDLQARVNQLERALQSQQARGNGTEEPSPPADILTENQHESMRINSHRSGDDGIRISLLQDGITSRVCDIVISLFKCAN